MSRAMESPSSASKFQQGKEALNKVLDYMNGSGFTPSLLRTSAGLVGGGLIGQTLANVNNSVNPFFDVDPNVATGFGIATGGIAADQLIKRAMARRYSE